eukprot:Tbor_TRINITY_DN5854_c1_g3::TRINITY_DN5854_c1_g3_i1::g.7025::m.7025/K14617/LMBRD1; LMBR1 domain-containing protein 1
MLWWLILIAVIAIVLIFGLVVYMVVLFQSEEEKTQAWFPKVVVVLGLSLACFNVLLLPYDVANRQNTEFIGNVGGGIDTALAWQIVMYLITAFTFVIVPFAMMYYEAMDPDQKNICNQIRPALISTIVILLMFTILVVSLWLTVGQAVIPYTMYTAGPIMHLPSTTTGQSGELLIQYSDVHTSEKLEIRVSFFVYLVSLLSAFGWVFFCVFGGVGLIAFPMDFIRNFRDRPKPITAYEFSAMKTEIAKESERLIARGKKLDEVTNKSSKHRKQVILYKQEVEKLERYYEKIKISFEKKGGAILKAVLQLILGILGGLLSFFWVLHVILNNITHVSTFLNSFFIALDNCFSLFGVLAYSLFAFYLLWCVVKGCTKIGVNLLLFTAYPMEVNNTLMNAFCFNTLLILITSVSVVQFSAISFAEYAANTAVNSIFTTYASRLKGIGFILQYIQYILLGIVGLSLLWLMICPRRKVEEDDE